MEYIKVLVVDDSLIYRKFIERALAGLNNIQVVGSLWNGVKTIEFLKSNQIPDIITLDVEMPEMDGLETLKKIAEINHGLPKEKKINVIMLSSLTNEGTQTTLKALEYGAADFILKPHNLESEQNFNELKDSLKQKISIITGQKILTDSNKNVSKVFDYKNNAIQKKRINAIVIGISTGGPKALLDYLPQISKVTDLPIFIVQHMPKEFTGTFAENLNRRCEHTVLEAEDSMIVKNKHIYIAPGGLHTTVKMNEKKQPKIILNDNPSENNCKPSADILFRSAADIYTDKLIAIVMTGMGDDGSKSLPALKRAGAVIIAQDKETSTVWGMPERAIQTGCVDYVVALNKIHDTIKQIIL